MTDVLICWRGDCRGAAMPAMLWPGHLATTHPSKEEPVIISEQTIRERYRDNHPGDVSFGHTDIKVLLDVIDALRDRLDVAQKEHREEMRDAGAEMRDLMSELNAAQRAAEGW